MNRSENRYNAVKKQKKNVNLIWRKEFRRIKKKHTQIQTQLVLLNNLYSPLAWGLVRS